MQSGVVEIFLVAAAAVAGLAAAVFAGIGALRHAAVPLSAAETAQLLRGETEILRSSLDDHSRGQRQELNQTLNGFQELTLNAFGTLREGIESQIRHFEAHLTQVGGTIEEKVASIAINLSESMDISRSEAHAGRDALRETIERKLNESAIQLSDASKKLREELGDNFERLGARVAGSLGEASDFQKERLEGMANAVSALTEKLEGTQKELRSVVESKLDVIRQENGTKLEEMRQTVDHKLQTTLENRLGESFNRVVEQLERVHKGIGEMQNLASNVGDLKNVLTNVKVRGTYGEVQLELLLEQFLSPEQYVKNAAVKAGSAERVEFAVRFPGEDESVLLPIDSKFPREDYDHLQEAIAVGDNKRAAQHRRDLENRVKNCAKEICAKYINPPMTLDLAILFIPTESLYAEVMRQPGLFEQLQRDFRVMIAGPTNLAALLTSFQMGFRTLALQKRSGEVWQLLGAIKKEFENYGEAVDKLSRQLTSANNSVENLGKRAKIMSRKLKTVEVLPNRGAAEKLLGLDGTNTEDDVEELSSAAGISSPIVVHDAQ